MSLVVSDNYHHNNFHLLRHVAAFLVVYAHCTPVGQIDFLYRLSAGRVEVGSLGVSIFFIISGYLVTQSLLRTTGRMRFLRKRWLRIWPALFVVTAVLCLLLGPAFSALSPADYFKSPETWRFFIRNILFLPVFELPGVPNGYAGNGNFWTIFFEVLCYLALFAIGKKNMVQYRLGIVIVWLAALGLKYFLPVFFHVPGFLEQYMPHVSGVVFFFFTASVVLLNDKMIVWGKKVWLTSLLTFLVCVSLPVYHPLLALVRDMALVFFVIGWGRSKAVMQWPSWDISYGVYLIGGIAQASLHYFGSPVETSRPALLAATLALTLPLAFASWYFVEKPALARK